MVGVHEWVGRVKPSYYSRFRCRSSFVGPQRFRRNRCELGAFLLQLCATRIMAGRCFSRISHRLHSPSSVCISSSAGSRSPRGIACKISVIFCSRDRDSLSILIKLPSILIGAPLACLAFQRFSIPPLRLGAAFRNLSLWSFGALALLPSALWYGHAYQIALQFYPHHFFGAGGVQIMSAAWYLKIVKEIVTSTLTPFVFVLGSVGVLVTKPALSVSRMGRSRGRGTLRECSLVARGNDFVHRHRWLRNRHQWYQLPLIPIAAVFAGRHVRFCRLENLQPGRERSLSILLAALFSFSVFVHARGFYRPSAAPLRDAGLKLKAVTPSNALVAAADNGDPTFCIMPKQRLAFSGEERDLRWRAER